MAEAALSETEGSHRVQRHARETTEKDQATELAEVRRNLAGKDAEIARLTGVANNATALAADLGKAAAAATTGRIEDREVAITNAIGAAEQSKNSAGAAVRAAREAGDVDAELKAAEQFTNAAYQLQKWQDEDRNFKARKPALLEDAKKAAEVQPAGAGGPNAAARQWVADHPRFNTDKIYGSAVMAAQEMAAERGMPGGSEASLDFIERELTARFGKDHGREGGSVTTERRERDHTSMAARPGGDGEGERGTAGTGNLRIVRDNKGAEILHGDIPAAWQEAAKWSGHVKAGATDQEEYAGVVAYAIERVKAEDEQKRGVATYFHATEGASFR